MTSFSAKPASRRRLAMASAAVVTLPTESVVLISMSCLKISRALLRLILALRCGKRAQSSRSDRMSISSVFLFAFALLGIIIKKKAVGPIGRSRLRRQRIAKPSRQIRSGPEKQNQAETRGPGQETTTKAMNTANPSWASSAGRQAAVHETRHLLRPLVNPVEAVDRNEMEPTARAGLIGYVPAGHCLQHDVKSINANQPIDQADEIHEKQIQRRDEERLFGQLRMQRIAMISVMSVAKPRR